MGDSEQDPAGNEQGDGEEEHRDGESQPMVPLARFVDREALRFVTEGIRIPELEQLQRTISSSIVQSSMFATETWFSSILPWRMELPAMRLMSDMSQTLLGSSSLSGLFAVQEATRRVHESLALTPEVMQPFSALAASQTFRTQLVELSGLADSVHTLLAAVLSTSRPLLVERAVVVGGRGWDEATRLLLPLADESSVDALGGLGRAATGIGASGLLLSEEEPDVDVEVPDWGRGAMQSALRDLLSDLDPSLPARLDGAWERVSRPGPDAASQAAHSLMELVDWALRLAAPDDVVLVWVRQEGRSGELHQGKPTRVVRLKYLVRDRPGEANIARLYQRALSDLVGIVQPLKHGAGKKELDAVMSLLPTVEGLLYFVLRP